MGKAKCRKPRRRRSRPTGIPSMKEMEEDLPESCTEANAVDTILEKLQSNSCEDKECSAAFISQMANNPKFVSLLIERDVVKIAAPFLVHPSSSVRYAICVCLRTLCICGGDTVPDAMVEQDVMTALTTLLHQYNKDWELTKMSERELGSKKKIFVEACGLLTNLCENSSLALEIFNKNDLLSQLLLSLKAKEFDSEITLAVVQSLYTVTENNIGAVQKLSQPEILEVLNFFASSSLPMEPCNLHLRSLASGVLFNQGCCNMAMSAGAVIIETIDDALKINIQPDFEKLTDIHLSFREAKKDKYREPGALEKKQAEMTEIIANIEHVLTAKQTVLEILTNICCSDDGYDWDETGSCSSLSDEMVDTEEISDVPAAISSNVPLEVRVLIVNKKIMQKLPQQIVILDKLLHKKVLELPEGGDLIKKLHLVKCRALLCVNNVIPTLDIDELGGPLQLFHLWMDFSNLIFTQLDHTDEELLEAATSSARAVLQKLAEAEDVSSHFSQMNDSDIKLFFDIYHKTEDLSIKVNIIRSAATVACILASMLQPNSHCLIKSIGSFLLDASIKSPKLWVTAEALDAIFDVFAEDHLDNIAQEINLVDKLQVLLPVMKGKIKQRKNALGEHLPVIMTAKTNLIRFLKYKSSCT